MRLFLALLLACGACSASTQETAPLEATPVAKKTETPRPHPVALEKFLRDDLSLFVVALSSDQAPQPPEPPTETPTAVKEALAALFEAAATAADDESKLESAVTRVNRALRSHQLPFAIDSAIVGDDSPTVLLFSFSVLDIRRYQVGAAVRSVLRAERLDNIAYSYRLLGFSAPDRDPIVLLGSIDEFLTANLLGHDEIGSGVGAESVAAAAHDAAAVIGGDSTRALAKAIAKRRQLVREWSEQLSARGINIRPPKTRLVAKEWRESLRDLVDPSDLEKLDAIEAELGTIELASAYSRLRSAVALATDHHELQHRIDFEAPLTSSIKFDYASDRRERIVAELSGVLAELARGEAAHLSLARLAAIATAPRNSLERISVRAAIGALTDQEPTLSGEELGVAIKTLAGLPADEIAKRAQVQWQTIFGRPLAAAEPTQASGVQASP